MADDLTRFRHNLAEAIAWCRPRAHGVDFRSSLRTPALRNFATDLLAYTLGQPLKTNVAVRQASLQALCEKRAALLRAEGRRPAMPAEDLDGGRLLLYDPDQTLSDGAAEMATDGFFDGDNAPPWDTWVWYAHDQERETKNKEKYATARGLTTPLYFVSYLVSWIPHSLVEMTNFGIDRNPERCIAWAGDVETVLTRQLKALRLLG